MFQLPPVEISKGYIATAVNEFHNIPVDLLSPEREVAQCLKPSSVALIQHFPYPINSLLVAHSLILQDKYNIGILALYEIFPI